MEAPRHFSALARRAGDSPISWLMKLALDRPELISLAAGFTDNETLPVDEVARLCRQVLARPKTARAALQYGTTIGLPQLRYELLRRWQQQDQLTHSQSRITKDDIVVTNGSQQLLYLISEVLCDPGDIVLVEDPTYFVYLGIVEALGLHARGFASVAGLKETLERLKDRRQLERLKLVYLVTYFRNPTGHTWSLDEKRETQVILKHYERAAGHPIYIVEDAAYRDLRFEGEDVASFKALDPRNQRVAYVNTLTKPFATGLKLGYGILPAALLKPVLRCKANHDFGSSNFLQAILARALGEGVYDRHLPRLAAAYRRKRDAMVESLAHHFPRTARYEIPRGGLYVWVELDRRTLTGTHSRVFRRALDAGVLYVPGEMCYGRDPSRHIPTHAMRLTFGTQPVAQIRRGIQLLAGALASVVLVLAVGCGQPSESPWTPLHRAADTGNEAQACKLIARQPGMINTDDGDGHTPLHVAADRGNDDLVAVLLDKGAKIDAPDGCGWTPLHTAAANGRTSTVRLLIERGAAINARDRQQQTPRRLAEKWNHPETAELLRARGGTD